MVAGAAGVPTFDSDHQQENEPNGHINSNNSKAPTCIDQQLAQNLWQREQLQCQPLILTNNKGMSNMSINSNNSNAPTCIDQQLGQKLWQREQLQCPPLRMQRAGHLPNYIKELISSNSNIKVKENIYKEVISVRLKQSSCRRIGPLYVYILTG